METTSYKRTIAGSVGAGMAAVFNASGRQYYILEHKTESVYHHVGESQKIIVDQVELGRDSACQVRFDESFETVSRRHAAIVKDGDGWKIIPLSQTNPTFVNGQPILADTRLNNGDEIRLSSKGPLMGFIVPQGKQSLVSSIGMTERLSLFRQQALRPYKRAIWTLAIILVLAIAGLVAWNIMQGKKFDKELLQKQQQIEEVQQNLEESDELIDALNKELIEAQNATAAEKARVRARLEKAQKEREDLIRKANGLQYDMQDAIQRADDAGRDIEEANKQIQQLEGKIQEINEKKQQETKDEVNEDGKSLSDIIRRNHTTKPDLK